MLRPRPRRVRDSAFGAPLHPLSDSGSPKAANHCTGFRRSFAQRLVQLKKNDTPCELELRARHSEGATGTTFLCLSTKEEARAEGSYLTCPRLVNGGAGFEFGSFQSAFFSSFQYDGSLYSLYSYDFSIMILKLFFLK